jgi:hypothetical protein
VSSRESCGEFGLAFFVFDDFPVTEDFGGIFGACFAEDVGMTANHFAVDFRDDVGDVEAAFFVSDLGVKEDLEEEIAEFFGEFGVVGAVESVEDFVGFFDEVGAESGVSLFAVPGTAIGSAEAGHYGDKLFEGRAYAWGGFCWTRGTALGCFAFGFAGGHEEIRLRGEWGNYKSRKEGEEKEEMEEVEEAEARSGIGVGRQDAAG